MTEEHPLTRRALVPLATALAAGLATLSPAYANTYVAALPVDASTGSDPFAACPADNVAQQETVLGSTLFPSAEPEPRLTIDPTNPRNLAGEFQQDRWSDGGSRGLVASGTTFEAFFGQAVSAGNPSDVHFATVSARR